MELVIRATVIYWFLWLVVRGSGKRALTEISPLDLLIIVVLGDFVQQGVTQEERLRLDDLLGEARESGYGRLDEIALGVLEADGRFSFVPASGHGGSAAG